MAAGQYRPLPPVPPRLCIVGQEVKLWTTQETYLSTRSLEARRTSDELHIEGLRHQRTVVSTYAVSSDVSESSENGLVGVSVRLALSFMISVLTLAVRNGKASEPSHSGHCICHWKPFSGPDSGFNASTTYLTATSVLSASAVILLKVLFRRQ